MLTWTGDALIKKMADAAKRGVDKTMSEAVIQAKQNHPGWNNRTGAAEGSIQVQQFAEVEGDHVKGVWGSVGIDYMIWLELNHGAALRSAADAIYPRLQQNIADALNR
jgi:hypothetical protein